MSENRTDTPAPTSTGTKRPTTRTPKIEVGRILLCFRPAEWKGPRPAQVYIEQTADQEKGGRVSVMVMNPNPSSYPMHVRQDVQVYDPCTPDELEKYREFGTGHPHTWLEWMPYQFAQNAVMRMREKQADAQHAKEMAEFARQNAEVDARLATEPKLPPMGHRPDRVMTTNGTALARWPFTLGTVADDAVAPNQRDHADKMEAFYRGMWEGLRRFVQTVSGRDVLPGGIPHPNVRQLFLDMVQRNTATFDTLFPSAQAGTIGFSPAVVRHEAEKLYASSVSLGFTEKKPWYNLTEDERNRWQVRALADLHNRAVNMVRDNPPKVVMPARSLGIDLGSGPDKTVVTTFGMTAKGPDPKAQKGLYRKFDVKRTDGEDGPGKKHEGCFLFVLDLTHDPHAGYALAEYADRCERKLPNLARDLREKLRAAGFSKRPPVDKLTIEVPKIEVQERMPRAVRPDEKENGGERAARIVKEALDNAGGFTWVTVTAREDLFQPKGKHPVITLDVSLQDATRKCGMVPVKAANLPVVGFGDQPATPVAPPAANDQAGDIINDVRNREKAMTAQPYGNRWKPTVQGEPNDTPAAVEAKGGASVERQAEKEAAKTQTSASSTSVDNPDGTRTIKRECHRAGEWWRGFTTVRNTEIRPDVWDEVVVSTRSEASPGWKNLPAEEGANQCTSKPAMHEDPCEDHQRHKGAPSSPAEALEAERKLEANEVDRMVAEGGKEPPPEGMAYNGTPIPDCKLVSTTTEMTFTGMDPKAMVPPKSVEQTYREGALKRETERGDIPISVNFLTDPTALTERSLAEQGADLARRIEAGTFKPDPLCPPRDMSFADVELKRPAVKSLPLPKMGPYPDLPPAMGWTPTSHVKKVSSEGMAALGQPTAAEQEAFNREKAEAHHNPAILDVAADLFEARICNELGLSIGERNDSPMHLFKQLPDDVKSGWYAKAAKLVVCPHEQGTPQPGETVKEDDVPADNDI